MDPVRPDFTPQFLGNICDGIDFARYCLPSHGKSGGILLGVNNTTVDVRKMEVGNYVVEFHLCSKLVCFDWVPVVVNGTVQHKHTPTSLGELI